MSNEVGWKMVELPGLNDCSTKSSRKSVTNGLPQGFILVSISFNNFINDMDGGTEHTLCRFAGGAKLRDLKHLMGCCCSERPWKANKRANMNILESGNQLCWKGVEDNIAQRSPVLPQVKLGRAWLPGPSREVYYPLLRIGETKSGGLYPLLGSTVQHRYWHTESNMKAIILCSRLLRKVGESVFLETFET